MTNAVFFVFVTIALVGKDIELLDTFEGFSVFATAASAFAADFDSLSAQDKARLKTFLKLAIERGQSRLAWESELHDQVGAVIEKFAKNLDPFEENILRGLRKEGVESDLKLAYYKKLLSDVYDQKNGVPASVEEIQELIQKIETNRLSFPRTVWKPSCATRNPPRRTN